MVVRKGLASGSGVGGRLARRGEVVELVGGLGRLVPDVLSHGAWKRSVN